MKMASVQEAKALAVNQFDVSAIIQRYGRAGRWHMILFYGNGHGEHSTHDTLAEAKALYLSSKWEAADAARDAVEAKQMEAAENRYYESGCRPNQMMEDERPWQF